VYADGRPSWSNRARISASASALNSSCASSSGPETGVMTRSNRCQHTSPNVRKNPHNQQSNNPSPRHVDAPCGCSQPGQCRFRRNGSTQLLREAFQRVGQIDTSRHQVKRAHPSNRPTISISDPVGIFASWQVPAALAESIHLMKASTDSAILWPCQVL
jgi:hypothetical protein